MNSAVDDLIASLKRQAEVARVEMANAPQDGRANWAAITPRTVAPVAAALRTIPVIAALEGRWYTLPNEAALISFDSVVVYLLERAQRVAAETIVMDLVRLAKEQSVTLIEARLIVGIEPTRVLDLGDGFSITPPDHTPSHDHVPFLFSEQNQPRHGWGGPPTGALIRRSNCNLDLQSPPTSPTPMLSKQVTSERDWQAALAACALTSDASPQFRQNFTVIADPGWVGMRSNGFGASESFPIPETRASFFDDAKVADLFQKLRPENKTINLAVNRLVSSRRRLSPEERALDLGTCIELLLMSGSKDNAEISYKVATRAAWLLGTNPADRLSCFKTARDLYADRSTAAHTGSLKTPRNMDEMNAQLARLRTSDALCVRVIVELLSRGMPKAEDWASIILDMPRPGTQ